MLPCSCIHAPDLLDSQKLQVLLAWLFARSEDATFRFSRSNTALAMFPLESERTLRRSPLKMAISAEKIY